LLHVLQSIELDVLLIIGHHRLGIMISSKSLLKAGILCSFTVSLSTCFTQQHITSSSFFKLSKTALSASRKPRVREKENNRKRRSSSNNYDNTRSSEQKSSSNSYNKAIDSREEDDDYFYFDDDDVSVVGQYDWDESTDHLDQQHQEQQQTSKHFFSEKNLSNPHFSIIPSTTFQKLCEGATITQPSRIQALSWPTLLQGHNTIVADQTGSGKTLAYLLPLLQRMIDDEKNDENQNCQKLNGSPKILILAPTAELADQIKNVCDKSASQLGKRIRTRVITATGSHSTNIRDQIRMLSNIKVDVLISTPGRIATILRTKNTSLSLAQIQSIVLDEVDVLLIDETFGPQLRTIGAAAGPISKTQFVFVTATLPDEIIESVKREFRDVQIIQGPGLHRIAPNLKENLVDVSVPPISNNDLDLCFEYKSKELLKALRANRVKRSLVFCNTVEACRKVENLIKRNDRRQSFWIVGAYHNAMNPENRRKNLNLFSRGLSEKALERKNKKHKKSGEDDVDYVLVCTDRAARGVDFDSAPVDHVILFDFPKDPAEYIRRVGRTARAGRVGTSTVFAYAWQLPIARKIMGSKLDSFTVAADGFNEDEEEYTQKQRRDAQRFNGQKDKMIRGNIKSGTMWK